MKLMKKNLRRLSSFSLFFLLQFYAAAQGRGYSYFGVEHGLPQSSIYSLVQDMDGNLWAGTMGGLAKYNGQGFTVYTKRDGLAENWITSSLSDSKGNIWFGHWAGGLSKYDYEKKKIEPVTLINRTALKSILCILEGTDGSLWLGTDGNGILHVNTSTLVTEAFDSAGSLGANKVYTIIKDARGRLWAGTESGIAFLEPGSSSWEKITVKGLKDEVSSLLEGNDGNIWAGTKSSGIFVYSPASESITRKYTEKDSLPAFPVNLLFTDAEKNIWAGTYGGGLALFLPGDDVVKDAKKKGKKDSRHFRVYSTRIGLSNNKILSLLQDREKNIWIGTNVGLNQFSPSHFDVYGLPEGLSNDLVWSVAQDKENNFWLGTEGGLIRFIPGKGNEESSFKKFITAKSYTNAVFIDSKGMIWVSNWGEGVSLLDPGTSKIKRFTKKEGLPTNDVYAIAEDKDGNIWFGTDKGGVAKYDPHASKSKFRIFDIKDGFRSNRVFTIFSDAGGRLWFGTLGGYLTVYDGTSFKTLDDKAGLKNQFIISLTGDKKGNLWIGTYGGGLYEYDGKVFQQYDIADGTSSNSAYSLASDDEDNLWIGANMGVDKFIHNGEYRFIHFSKDEGFGGIEANPNAVCMDNKGDIWFGTILGAVRYKGKNDRLNNAEAVTQITSVQLFYKDSMIPQGSALSYSQNHLTFRFVGISLTNPKKVRYQYMMKGVDKDWSPLHTESYASYPDLSPGTYTFLLRSANNDGVWNKEPVTFSFIITPPFWKTRTFYVLLALVLLASGYGVVQLRLRKIRKEKMVLEQKVKERTEEIAIKNMQLEEKNKDITDSINYAKRIQDAILPLREEIVKVLPDSFILYKPRDIVSGDFYWYFHQENKILIAAVDCTGHGVPGAFMSMIGNEILNHIVIEKRITDPAEILNNLHEGVRVALRQGAGSAEARDGMDISLCAIDKERNTVSYAGANRPLWILRPDRSNGQTHYQLTEVKGDKFPIGGIQTEERRFFRSNSISISPGDSIYLFTDGFADQFGGEKGKKFMAKRFQQTLADAQQMSMKEQASFLENSIVEWKGGLEQVDDILVIGVRF